MGKNEERLKWFDDASGTPLIESHARRLGTFLEALADGKIDESEVQAQEKRLVDLMKEVEPLLDDEVHGKVTQLLCELTAYDLMQVLSSFEQAKPRTQFKG